MPVFLPLVKTLWFYKGSRDIVPPRSLLSLTFPNPRSPLPDFPFTSVSQLRIDYLDIPRFLLQIPWNFRDFFPTLRSLALEGPKGSHREIIYFIGLFQHLQDLKLVNKWVNNSAGDPTLIPSFIPPLQGLLTARNTPEGLWKDLIEFFGGLRFRHMDLFQVDEMQLLLKACAKTLESVVLHPSDLQSEQLPLNGTQVLTNDRIAWVAFQDFDLSRNESLRTLKFPASPPPVGRLGSNVSRTISFLKYVLSTITSPSFSRVVVLYEDHDFPDTESWSLGRPPFHHELSQAGRAGQAAGHSWQFEVLREVQKVRPFQLVLCVNVWGCVGEYPVQMLEEAVAKEKAKGTFSNGSADPFVVYNPRRTRYAF